MPKCCCAAEKSGVHSRPVKNSRKLTAGSAKKPTVSLANAMMTPSVVSTDTLAHTNKSAPTTLSPTLRFARRVNLD